jgi:hypothetical protein
MSEMTQQNAANSEESAASAVELDNLAHKMQKMVDAFNLGNQQSASSDFAGLPKNSAMTKSKFEKKSPSFSHDTKWRPNGKESAPKLTFDTEFDALRDF